MLTPITNFGSEEQHIPEGAALGVLEELDDGVAEGERNGEGPTIDDFYTKVNKTLLQEEKEQVMEVLLTHQSCFAKNSSDLGKCPIIQHTIDVGMAGPIHQRPFKNAWKEREIIQKQVDEMMQ